MKKNHVIHLYREDLMPQAIIPISREWTRLSDAYGDVGSCVLGAGFEFTYEGQRYFLPPWCKWQGSCSWEAYVEKVKKELLDVGCTELRYNWGNMD